MKENKIEKLILDLSNRWECTPQEAVDRLNSMNESEINKLIKDMVKKFQPGGSLEKDIVFPERPHTFIPSEMEPVSRRDALRKYENFGYNRRQARRIYDRTADYMGRDNAAKWMSAAWDQRAPDQTGYLVPVEGQLPWEKAPAMQPGIEIPITNSDPQYIEQPRNFKFQTGGELYKQPAFWEYIKQKQQEQVEIRRKRLDEMSERLQHAWDVANQTPEGNIEIPLALRDSVLWEKLALDKELKTLEQMKQAEEMNSPFSFQNGGIMKCLKGGKTYTECKKCGGKTPIVKDQHPAEPLRRRGTAPASSGMFQPDTQDRDSLWVSNNGASVRNHFWGNDLTQYFITPGFNGTPRLQKRIIYNYNTPAVSDTVYVDGYGVRSGHSQKYIDSVNRTLSGAEPYATSGKEVRDMKKGK